MSTSIRLQNEDYDYMRKLDRVRLLFTGADEEVWLRSSHICIFKEILTYWGNKVVVGGTRIWTSRGDGGRTAMLRLLPLDKLLAKTLW